MFRVRAVNAAGLSQFSPESEPVEVKAAIGEWSYAVLLASRGHHPDSHHECRIVILVIFVEM